jgi:hypothetical protein
MIYILCNVETGELLGISEEPISVSGSPLQVRTIDRDMPDMTKVTWERNLLDFVDRPIRTLTKLDYLRRFTAEERINIRAVCKTNAVLEDFMVLMDLASEINLDDPDTIAGVHTLEAVGLLAQGRTSEILA